ncbi:MAG: carbon-nitrogen hydrolase family protein, partial [Bosea sp. (in: a-proteobacteria)]
MKLAALQMNSVSSVAANIAQATQLVERAAGDEGADWLCLPEHWNWAGGGTAEKLANADVPRGVAYAAMQALAARHKIWLHAGSLLERVSGEDKVWNVTYAFDRQGREVARYAKIHLFDITAPDGMVYAESATVKPGREVVTYDCEGITVGCAICYDLRFPELFQVLRSQGAQLIALPSSFTLQTGKDHWEVLIRARAIETQCYIAAPGQHGSFIGAKGETRHTYGHSLIADPWGHVIAKASDGVGVAAARLDKGFLEK